VKLWKWLHFAAARQHGGCMYTSTKILISSGASAGFDGRKSPLPGGWYRHPRGVNGPKISVELICPWQDLIPSRKPRFPAWQFWCSQK
jgi:hypothetical protein